MFTRLLTFTGTDNIDAGVTYLRDEQETLVEDYLQAIKGASSVAKAA